MTFVTTDSRRSRWGGVLLAILAGIVFVGAAAMAISAFGPRGVSVASGQQPSPSASAPPHSLPEPTTVLEEPMPLPEGETALAVLDPALENPSVGADEAIALARAGEGSWIGESPTIQLLRIAFRDPGSDFAPVWTGWVILSTDLPWRGSAGPYRESFGLYEYFAAYTWVYLSVEGEPIGTTQVAYDTREDVPPLP